MTTAGAKPPLAERVALVTGASRGIGRGIATRLARDGARVIVHYGTNSEAAAETVSAITAAGGRAFAVGQRLGVEGDIASLFERLDNELAGAGLDILVNNAGIAIDETLADLTPEGYEQQFAVNTRAVLFITQAAAARMNHGGRIISITSGTTLRALPEWLVYSMTKVAVESMTRIVAAELAPRAITVNAVSAGIVDTDMNAPWFVDKEQREAAAQVAALGRIGLPADIADVVAFLASEEARWVTGHVVDATGGSFL
ncbi:MAG TPA: SDR family oxidoreductase [Solirubrobacteraceae bacterium]|nr:SDR family oxidoreductase [Solirubrobacteraceae bacterium]